MTEKLATQDAWLRQMWTWPRRSRKHLFQHHLFLTANYIYINKLLENEIFQFIVVCNHTGILKARLWKYGQDDCKYLFRQHFI
jgi:hypothetical protein